MYVIHAENVNEAYPQGYTLLDINGVYEDSRAGKVIVAPFSVTTVYDRPDQRVLFAPERDANPFFHFFEALWVLAGRRDVAYLAQFNSRMGEYSDDRVVFNAAYGYRLRSDHFGDDQLMQAVAMLKKDPASRRVFVGIWDPAYDLGADSKDIPCNLGIKFDIRADKLNAIVFNRSNDMIWGAYGANVVQFSMIQEYVARRLDVPMGTLTQVSGNFHAYLSVYEKHRPKLETCNNAYAPEQPNAVTPFPIMDLPSEWDSDLQLFMEDPYSMGFRNVFFHKVARPLWHAWFCWKAKDFRQAYSVLENCAASDWRLAAELWLQRRELKHAQS